MKKITLAVLGCGNMAQAVLRALWQDATQNKLREKNISLSVVVSDVDENKLAAVQNAMTTTDNTVAVQNADYVLLAVKPQQAAEALAPLDLRGKTLLSIMAGVKQRTLRELTGCEKTVRIMPNLNARVLCSFNAYAAEGINDEEREFTELLLDSFGQAVCVQEEQLDAVTGLTGSSPAFVFMLIQAFADEGVAQGFSPETARNMAVCAVLGSAQTVLQSTEPLETLIESVCSKGGTTIEGVQHLRAQNFQDTVRTAVRKAIERSKELSQSK